MKPITTYGHMGIVPIAPDEHPEMSTTDHWRGVMQRARKAHGLTQAQLGARVGVSQNVISGLEDGRVSSSKAVLPICSELDIPPPYALITDYQDQRWVDAGRVLRSRAPQVFDTLLETAEKLAQQYSTTPDEH